MYVCAIKCIVLYCNKLTCFNSDGAHEAMLAGGRVPVIAKKEAQKQGRVRSAAELPPQHQLHCHTPTVRPKARRTHPSAACLIRYFYAVLTVLCFTYFCEKCNKIWRIQNKIRPITKGYWLYIDIQRENVESPIWQLSKFSEIKIQIQTWCLWMIPIVIVYR